MPCTFILKETFYTQSESSKVTNFFRPRGWIYVVLYRNLEYYVQAY